MPHFTHPSAFISHTHLCLFALLFSFSSLFFLFHFYFTEIQFHPFWLKPTKTTHHQTENEVWAENASKIKINSSKGSKSLFGPTSKRSKLALRWFRQIGNQKWQLTANNKHNKSKIFFTTLFYALRSPAKMICSYFLLFWFCLIDDCFLDTHAHTIF